jgi:hypothetical protein
MNDLQSFPWVTCLLNHLQVRDCISPSMAGAGAQSIVHGSWVLALHLQGQHGKKPLLHAQMSKLFIMVTKLPFSDGVGTCTAAVEPRPGTSQYLHLEGHHIATGQPRLGLAVLLKGPCAGCTIHSVVSQVFHESVRAIDLGCRRDRQRPRQNYKRAASLPLYCASFATAKP